MVVNEYVSSVLPKRNSPCNDSGRLSAHSDRVLLPLSQTPIGLYGQIDQCMPSPGGWGYDPEDMSYFNGYKEPLNLPRRPSTTGSISNQTPEGRLARSLKRWMPSYEMKFLSPQPFPPRQPVYSARLADRIRIKRSDSSESVDTQISLLTCSTYLSNTHASPKRRRRRKKKQPDVNPDGTAKPSIWIQLANKAGGELDRMLRKHAMYALQDTDSEIYKNLDVEEKEMVTHAGMCRGMRLGPGRQRSDSASNTHKKLPQRKKPKRTQSAGGEHEGPMLNFQEVRRQMINQRLALQTHRSRHSGRKSLSRSLSRHSLFSNASSDVFTNATPRETSPLQMVEDTTENADNPVSVWKGDSQILAIDLKRGLTAKVKSKISSTTSALDRVTGYGEDNESRCFVGTLEEYPYLVEEDFSHIAKVPQRVRISPHLSHVIRTDIHVRMGRPRYHEIRVEDVRLWTKGQVLDRSHRNLKVFNWLHSLRESDFDMSLPEGCVDIPPGGDVTTRDETIVAVDEPRIKPLLERLKTEYIV